MSLENNSLKRLMGSLFMATILVFSTLANAKKQSAASFGELYYDGTIVRTVVPPVTMSKPDQDDFYVVVNGVVPNSQPHVYCFLHLPIPYTILRCQRLSFPTCCSV